MHLCQALELEVITPLALQDALRVLLHPSLGVGLRVLLHELTPVVGVLQHEGGYMLSLQSSHPDHQSMNCFTCQFDRPVHATAITRDLSHL